MEHHLPLHALVVVHSHQPRDRLADVRRMFPEHEIISSDIIRRDLVGTINRPDLSAIFFSEMLRRIALKLSLGERVVAIVGPLRYEQRMLLAKVAINQGAGLIYVIDPNDQRMVDISLAGGDGCAKVLQLGEGILKPVITLPNDPIDHLKKHWRGVTVIADVHGMLDPLRRALAWARSRSSFVWLLGDYIDTGAQTLEVADLVYHTVMHGHGAVLLGNHERKIASYLQQEVDGQSRLKLNDGNRVTTNALEQMSLIERAKWVGRFRSLLGRSSLISHLGDITFVHGAVHPHVWGSPSPDHREIEAYALNGERDASIPLPGYARGFSWVDSVPVNKTVMVGHSIRSPLPLTVTGARGGRVVFLDTGCGKGGRLSTADLRFDDDGVLKLESFMLH